MNQISPRLAARQSRGLLDAATAGLGTARPPHISRKGNRFTLVDGAGNQKNGSQMDDKGNVYIDLVVIDVNPHKSKMYFDGNWSEDSSDPPACFSDNGTGPSTLSAKPQAPSCAVCPMNEWGSATSKMTGAPTRACRDMKKVAVIVPGDESELVYEFVVPPGSFSDKDHGWTRFCNSVKGYMIGDRKADICDVVTRVSFIPGKMGVLAFQPVSLVNDDLIERMEIAWEKGMTDEVVGKLDKPRDPSQAVAPRPVAQAAPAPQLAPPPLPMSTTIAAASVGLTPQQLPQPVDPPKRRGRPSTKAQQPEPEEIPQFLQRTPIPAAAPAPQPAQTAGIVHNPAAPPPDLAAALDNAFALKPLG